MIKVSYESYSTCSHCIYIFFHYTIKYDSYMYISLSREVTFYSIIFLTKVIKGLLMYTFILSPVYILYLR